MRSFKIFLTIFLTSTFTWVKGNASPLDSLLCYYPLNEGDKWFFSEIFMESDGSGGYRDWSLEVINDTLMPNNKIYTQLQKTYLKTANYVYKNYQRIDTTELKIYEYDSYSDTTDFEKIILDFSMNLGDTLYTSYWTIIFEETKNIQFFDSTFYMHRYSHLYGLVGYGDFYLKNIGLYKYTEANDFYWLEATLKGCIIDGWVYGDTSLTSLKDLSGNFPSDYILHQNYPNPFNSETNVKFTIPVTANVTIKIYNIIGEELFPLVDEIFTSGDHEVCFNANNLSSGIYLYKMQSGDMVKTRKMILIK